MQKRHVDALSGMAALIVGFSAFVLGSTVALEATPQSTSKPDQPAQAKQISITPPPMGWSSWNSFSNTVDSDVIVSQTNAMVASGMKKAGYQYINIDEGWWLGTRDSQRNIVVDPKQWPALDPNEHPGDMANIVKYIHKAGLKAGIYTDAGESGCSFYGPDLGPPMPHTGSEGHYDQDFLQFARWGFDYVKVDWCGGDKENLDPAVQYAAIAHAIARAEKVTGHQLYYSICNWGNNSPWTWAPGVGGVTADIWRTSGDIVAPIVDNTPNGARSATLSGVLTNFDRGVHPEAQHTGFYNDLDMMMVGMQGLSEANNRIHMSLWAISGAPLIVGADLTKLNKTTKEILTNPEILSINQDRLGLQAVNVGEPVPGLQVWTKPLASGGHAVLLLNRTSAPAQMNVSWKAIGLDPSSLATLRDLWNGQDKGSYSSTYAVTVPATDVVFLTIRGTDAKATVYQGNKSLTFKIAPITKPTFVQVRYVNRGKSPVIAQLKVDGQIPTSVIFPPTEGGKTGQITLEVQSKYAGTASSLDFSDLVPVGLTLVSVATLAGGQ